MRIHPTSVVDKELKRKVVFIGCLETETPACSSFDVYSALLCVNPRILLKVAGIQSASRENSGNNVKKPADEAFFLHSRSFTGTHRTLAAPGIDERLRSAGYLLRESQLLKEAQGLAVHGKLNPRQMALVGQQALSSQVYDDLFKLSLMKLNEARTLGRLAQAEREKTETLRNLSSEVEELRRYQSDLTRIALELDKRRNGLAEAILREMQEAEGGTVCVLCGLSEKAAFTEQLSKRMAEVDFSILEYWLAPTA